MDGWVITMNEQDIMKGNLKLSVFDSFDYKELRKICDAIMELGYDCQFVSNGNVVFQKQEEEKGMDGWVNSMEEQNEQNEGKQ